MINPIFSTTCKSNAIWFKPGGRYEDALDFIYLSINKAPVKKIKVRWWHLFKFYNRKRPFYPTVFSFGRIFRTYFSCPSSVVVLKYSGHQHKDASVTFWRNVGWSCSNVQGKTIVCFVSAALWVYSSSRELETTAKRIRSHLAGHLWIIQPSVLFAESSFRVLRRLAYQLSKHICHLRHLTHPLCASAWILLSKLPPWAAKRNLTLLRVCYQQQRCCRDGFFNTVECVKWMKCPIFLSLSSPFLRLSVWSGIVSTLVLSHNNWLPASVPLHSRHWTHHWTSRGIVGQINSSICHVVVHIDASWLFSTLIMPPHP